MFKTYLENLIPAFGKFRPMSADRYPTFGPSIPSIEQALVQTGRYERVKSSSPDMERLWSTDTRILNDPYFSNHNGDSAILGWLRLPVRDTRQQRMLQAVALNFLDLQSTKSYSGTEYFYTHCTTILYLWNGVVCSCYVDSLQDRPSSFHFPAILISVQHPEGKDEYGGDIYPEDYKEISKIMEMVADELPFSLDTIEFLKNKPSFREYSNLVMIAVDAARKAECKRIFLG